VDCHVIVNISVNLLSNKTVNEWWGLKFEQRLTLQGQRTRQQKLQTPACKANHHHNSLCEQWTHSWQHYLIPDNLLRDYVLG
jgi:hypothetical protein